VFGGNARYSPTLLELKNFNAATGSYRKSQGSGNLRLAREPFHSEPKNGNRA